jgi:hypothetical protein
MTTSVSWASGTWDSLASSKQHSISDGHAARDDPQLATSVTRKQHLLAPIAGAISPLEHPL